MSAISRSVDRPVLIAVGFIVVMLVAGSLYSANFLSANFLLQKLQVASFLGTIASGLMLVILLGHIDLSIPWIVTVGGMMSTAVAGWFGDLGAALAIPLGILCGLVFGIVNGIGAVLIACFATSGACSALAGVLLSGYSTKAYLAMGDRYLLPAIAAVVLGGTNILGGRGSYLGTIASVILIGLLQSILSVMQMLEAGRQIIYGVVIVARLLVYDRGEKVQG